MLESGVTLPTYVLVWAAVAASELVHLLLASAGLAVLGRAVGAGMTGLGITVYGVDWAVHHGPTVGFRGSWVAALALAIVPNVAGAVAHVLLHLAWTGHPRAPQQQPLPIHFAPDTTLAFVRPVALVAAAYYAVRDPHGHVAAAVSAAGYNGRAFSRTLHATVSPLAARYVRPTGRGPGGTGALWLTGAWDGRPSVLVYAVLLLLEFRATPPAAVVGPGFTVGLRPDAAAAAAATTTSTSSANATTAGSASKKTQ
jgi:hypothetical protein